jgi:hypothetical protein
MLQTDQSILGRSSLALFAERILGQNFLYCNSKDNVVFQTRLHTNYDSSKWSVVLVKNDANKLNDECDNSCYLDVDKVSL